MYRQFDVEFQFGDTLQVFSQDTRFDLQLMSVAGVLIVTSATSLKIRAPWLDTLCRCCNDVIYAGASKTWFLFEQGGLDSFIFKDEGDKYGFSSATFIRRQAGKAIATVYKFFDC